MTHGPFKEFLDSTWESEIEMRGLIGILEMIDGTKFEFSMNQTDVVRDNLGEDLEATINATATAIAKMCIAGSGSLDEKILLMQLQLSLAWIMGREQSINKILFFISLLND